MPARLARLRGRLPRGMRRVQWLFGVWTAAVLLFLYAPIAVLALWSFNDSPYAPQWNGLTTKWYSAFWHRAVLDLHDTVDGSGTGWRRAWLKSTDWLGAAAADDIRERLHQPQVWGQVPGFVDGIKNSLLVGVCATAVSVALGTAGAWATFRYRYPLHRAVVTLVAVPMVVPEIIMGVSLLALITLASGLLGRVGLAFDRGTLAVICAHVTFCFPYVMVTINARLAGLDPVLEEAALDLGATPARAFRKVVLPYLMPAIVSGTLMAFTLSLDDFIVTYFVCDADSQTLPIRIYGAAKGPAPMLHVVSTLLVGGTVLLVVAAELIKRLGRQGTPI